MRNIIICPIKAVLEEITQSTAYYILCSSYEIHLKPTENSLILHFFDTCNPRNPYVFTKEDAIAILTFFDSFPSDADVFVCCDSGESRSPAVAAALMRYQGESDYEIWNSSEYHPNSLVFDILWRCVQDRNSTRSQKVPYKSKNHTTIS